MSTRFETFVGQLFGGLQILKPFSRPFRSTDWSMIISPDYQLGSWLNSMVCTVLPCLRISLGVVFHGVCQGLMTTTPLKR